MKLIYMDCSTRIHLYIVVLIRIYMVILATNMDYLITNYNILELIIV